MNEKKNPDNIRKTPPGYFLPPYAYQQDDEIDWMEIVNILRARKRQIIAIFLVVIVIGSVFAGFKQDIYSYSIAVQIGTMVDEDREKLIDEVKNAESALKEIDIPAVLNAYYQQNPGVPRNIKIDVSVPKDSRLVVLSGKSSIESSPPYMDLLVKAGNVLIQKHNEKIASQREVIHKEIESAKSRIELLIQNGKDAAERAAEIDKKLARMDGQSSATAALVVTELAGQQLEIENQIYTLRTLIDKKESWLKRIAETKLLMPVAKSSEPVGMSKKSVILLTVLAGLMLAILFAFISDFYVKMKSRLAEADKNNKRQENSE